MYVNRSTEPWWVRYFGIGTGVPMKRRELPSVPWVDVAIDLLGPLPDYDYLLVIIDYYSRYKEIKKTKVITGSQITKF